MTQADYEKRQAQWETEYTPTHSTSAFPSIAAGIPDWLKRENYETNEEYRKAFRTWQSEENKRRAWLREYGFRAPSGLPVDIGLYEQLPSNAARDQYINIVRKPDSEERWGMRKGPGSVESRRLFGRMRSTEYKTPYEKISGPSQMSRYADIIKNPDRPEELWGRSLSPRMVGKGGADRTVNYEPFDPLQKLLDYDYYRLIMGDITPEEHRQSKIAADEYVMSLFPKGREELARRKRAQLKAERDEFDKIVHEPLSGYSRIPKDADISEYTNIVESPPRSIYSTSTEKWGIAPDAKKKQFVHQILKQGTHEKISSPSQISQYTNIVKDPRSDDLWGVRIAEEPKRPEAEGVPRQTLEGWGYEPVTGLATDSQYRNIMKERGTGTSWGVKPTAPAQQQQRDYVGDTLQKVQEGAWTAPAGYEKISGPSQIPQYSETIKEPGTVNLWGQRR